MSGRAALASPPTSASLLQRGAEPAPDSVEVPGTPLTMYRLRLARLLPAPIVRFELRVADSALLRWGPVAKDGAELGRRLDRAALDTLPETVRRAAQAERP